MTCYLRRRPQVKKHKNTGSKLSWGTHLFLQELVELCLAVCEPAPVGRVDDPDEPVGRLEVVPPVRPQRLLATHVPNVQVETLERERGRNLAG